MNLDDQLRHHDPARDIPDDLGHSPRALATLARLTATAPLTQPSRPAHRKRATRYALAATVVTAGVVLAPILSTGDAAFADWDAVPRPATTQEAAHYAQECATWTQVSLGDYQPKVIEIRGTWVMTYLASEDGEAQCLRSTTPAPGFADGENESQFGPLAQTPAADALATVGVLETSGGIVSGTQFMVSGKVGTQVTGVVFETEGVHVRATVADGRFTAWWPQRKPASLLGRLIDHSGYNGSPNPTVKITLSTGKTITAHVKDYDVNH